MKRRGAGRSNARLRIAALLNSSALVAAAAVISFAALTMSAPTAWAQATGGAGGFGVFDLGGNGGNPGQTGSPGSVGLPPGGAAGTAPSGNGGDGTDSCNCAGGGGGGGANGATASPSGGNGGNGASAGLGNNSSGGGGGGAGGTGIIITSSFTNSGTVKGGTGGNGGAGAAGSLGNNAGNGGGGGGGGFGIIATIGGLTITNNAGASIIGGNGGAGGAGSTGSPSQTGTAGAAGAGGVGIQGAGITIVNNGTILGGLSGDGVTRADAIVFTGGINFLTGTGTVGSFTMPSGSTFAPGSAPGTSMTVAGNLVLQSGAFYLVQINPSAATSANVSGTATLTGASVQTVFAPGRYLTRQYTILHSGGLIGTFAGVSGNVPFGISESLSYTATDVILNLTANLVGLGCFTLNQCNVAGAISNFFNNGGALPPNFLALFGLTGANLANALTLLSGEPATGAQQPAFQLMNEFLGIMLDPFVDGRAGVGGMYGGIIVLSHAITRKISIDST